MSAKTILLVEDNADELMIYSTLLSHRGYLLITAGSERERLQQLEPARAYSNRFNCVAAASSVSSRLQKANRTNRRPSAGS